MVGRRAKGQKKGAGDSPGPVVDEILSGGALEKDGDGSIEAALSERSLGPCRGNTCIAFIDLSGNLEMGGTVEGRRVLGSLAGGRQPWPTCVLGH